MINFLTRFEDYFTHSCKLEKHNSVLCAVSGGIDSVALLHLLCLSGFKPVVAHCNFQLRSKESDAEQKFVEGLAIELSLKIHVKSFKTIKYAQENGISIEMAARDLRYQWFESLRKSENIDFIAVGHHMDDKVETVLLNLIRGTGIKGLGGIQAVNGKIIRPLLFASRQEIEELATQQNWAFCTDSSNLDENIKRNLIRHKILPLMKTLNPGIIETINKETEIWRDINNLMSDTIDLIIQKISTTISDKVIQFDFSMYASKPYAKTLLYEIIKPYGFNAANATDILKAQNWERNRTFKTDNYRLVTLDQFKFEIEQQESNNQKTYSIDAKCESIAIPINLSFSKENYKAPKNKDLKKWEAAFDIELLEFPLTLRKWQPGDWFCPFGMNGRKKLSDFFTDQKLTLPEKENLWILCSGENIIWIVGYRTDNRYRLTTNTKQAWKCTLKIKEQ